MARDMLHCGGRVAITLSVVLFSCTAIKNRPVTRKGAAGTVSDEKPISTRSCDASDQVEGDCKKLVCNSDGGVETEDDDTDEPKANPCQKVSCKAGEPESLDVPDGTPCNESGRCSAGRCKDCEAGGDCTRSNDCTIFKTKCIDGKASCEDTGVARDGRGCQPGKVCYAGSCVPCVVGAACDVGTPCYLGRVKSCDNGLECDPQPESGMSCGSDGMGGTMYCVKGLCTTPCREGPCMTTTNPCMTSHWDCSNVGAAPACASIAVPDGAACDTGSCRAGNCASTALLNGDFSRGLQGWTTAGDGAKFVVQPDAGDSGRITLSTSTDGSSMGGAARGSVLQTFKVPADAIAIRFNISGGHAHVRLKDGSGSVLEDCTGVDDDSSRIPVSWDLVARRGMSLTLAIEDDVDTGDFAYVTSTGFDVVRDTSGPLRNPQFSADFAGWETTGDGLSFNLFTDNNHTKPDLSPDRAYGTRRSLSTFARAATAAAYGDASRGTVSQMFLVPTDAVALRFNLHGGTGPSVSLYHDGQKLESVTATGSDLLKVRVSWDLERYRGMMLRLSIEDDSISTPYGYIGTSGFDLITSYNGP